MGVGQGAIGSLGCCGRPSGTGGSRSRRGPCRSLLCPSFMTSQLSDSPKRTLKRSEDVSEGAGSYVRKIIARWGMPASTKGSSLIVSNPNEV